MRLWHYPHAPYSRKVLVAAREKGIAFESVVCPPFEPEAKARLKARSPYATVPLLEVDGEPDLVQSSLIVEYFDLVSREGPELVPRDPMRALRVRAFDAFVDSALLAPTAYLAWAPRKPPETQNVEKIASMRRTLDHGLGDLERAVAAGPYAFGADLGLADLGAACAIASLLTDRTIPDLARWPSVAAWFARVTARDSWQGVLADWAHVPLPPALAK